MTTAYSKVLAELHFDQDPVKVQAAVIYLTSLSKNDPYFGERKLYKLLYYSDMFAYATTDKPITGTMYIHYPHGPFPENWPSIKRDMIDAKYIQIVGENTEQHHNDNGINLIIPGPDDVAYPDVLTDAEFVMLATQVENYRRFNFSGMDEHSQEEAPWRATNDGDYLPYEMALLSVPPSSYHTMLEGRRIAADIVARGLVA